jgi:hypothetical protein
MSVTNNSAPSYIHAGPACGGCTWECHTESGGGVDELTSPTWDTIGRETGVHLVIPSTRHPIHPSSHHLIIPSSHHPIIPSSHHPIITIVASSHHPTVAPPGTQGLSVWTPEPNLEDHPEGVTGPDGTIMEWSKRANRLPTGAGPPPIHRRQL